MFFPSQNLRDRLLCEWTGLFFDDDGHGGRRAFLKLPTNLVKRIRSGCLLKLVVCETGSSGVPVVAAGVRVYDDPSDPHTSTRVLGLPSDKDDLLALLAGDVSSVQFVDETVLPVMSATVQPSGVAVDSARAALAVAQASTLSAERISRALDYAEAISKQVGVGGSHPDWHEVTLDLSSLKVPSLAVAGFGSVSLDDEDEGAVLERAAAAFLGGMNWDGVHLNPYFIDGGKQKELCDVLAVKDAAVVMVQAKAEAVYRTANDRATARRAASVVKAVTEKLHQSQGAIRKWRSGEQIYSATGERIEMPDASTGRAHGIVLLTEMHPAVEWKEVASEIRAAASPNNLIQVMDLVELQRLAIAGTSAVVFEYNIVCRFEAILKNGDALVRVVVPPDTGEAK